MKGIFRRAATEGPAVRAEKAAGGSAGGTPSRAAEFIDPPTLMRIKSLQLRARIVVQGFLSGLHRSPHHGFSVEFSEYRQYSPGDDPRSLDGKLYARTDRSDIKRFEEETNLRCHLLVELSRSSHEAPDMARRAIAFLRGAEKGARHPGASC